MAAVGHLVVWGNAGTGKTTALQHRLLRLLQDGISAYNILVLVSEYSHEQPYLDLIHQSKLGPYAQLHITTYNSLAREMVVLFWPLVARQAGFEQPHLPPSFLEYDMAQLLMWQILRQMEGEGAFADVRLRPQRLVSQLLDMLNRASYNGLSLDQAIERQRQLWQYEPEQLKLLADAGIAAHRFREYCFRHSLLDFSLVIQVFDTFIVNSPHFGRYFTERYRYLLIDNVEEHTFAAQNFILQLMGKIESVAVAFDRGGGYRRFLSADPNAATRLISHCEQGFPFTESFISTPALSHLADYVENFLLIQQGGNLQEAASAILGRVHSRYRREMVANVPAQLHRLMMERNIQPSQIAILAPYLDGALQYTLQQELKNAGIPYRLLRRQSSPREEPRIRAWLTWLALAHPDWQISPSPYDVAEALSLNIHDLDPIRAALIAKYLYDQPTVTLLDSSHLPNDLRSRIGTERVQRVDQIRLWLQKQYGTLPLDQFLYQLFNDLLSRPEFQPEPDVAGAAVCDWLVRTATRLRQNAPAIGLETAAQIGQTFSAGIYQGLVTANPPDLGEPPDPNGIVIATAYGYLLSGLHSAVQVWLECNIMGWWQTPYQPLSNAFVMLQSRNETTVWTEQENIEVHNDLLNSVIRGLTSRCQQGILLTTCDLDRRGQRQSGHLWRAIQPLLKG